MNKYTPPPQHAVPENAEKFLATLSEKDREVHRIAQRDLGSSYFMARTNGYSAWRRATT